MPWPGVLGLTSIGLAFAFLEPMVRLELTLEGSHDIDR